MKLRIQSRVTHYQWDTFGEGIKAIAGWHEKDLITEEEIAEYICQMFNQIPDQLYNDIQERL